MVHNKPLARLTDLPTEILQEIISHLDDDGLLQLGLTCKVTNTLALAAFFARNDMRHPEWFVCAYEKPVETLPALRAALFVKQLRQIHFYLNPNLDRLVGEVVDLRSLVARVSSVGVVKIHLSGIDLWIKTPSQVAADRMERSMWVALFAGLLDVILGRSCTQLVVGGGDRLHELYTPEPVCTPEPVYAPEPVCTTEPKPVNSQPPPVPVHTAVSEKERRWQRSLRKMVRRIFRRPTRSTGLPVQIVTPTQETKMLTATTIGTKNPHDPVNPPLKNVLRDLEIHSDMLLQASFLAWTLSRVSAASATLTKLSFKCSSSVPNETWQTVFTALSLPCLLDFELCTHLIVYPGRGARFVDVMHFLSRHPSLSIVHLHGVEVPVPAGANSNSILPQITTFTAHPLYVTHILHYSQDRLPGLSSVGISTEYTSPSSVDFTAFDAALHSIASFKFAGPITLTLRFQCHDGVDDWFAAHRELGSRSPLASLHPVTSLIIACAYHVDLPSRVTAHFDEWLALFPSVEKIEFTERTVDHLKKRFLDPEFLKRLAAACPKLKEVGVVGEFIGVASGALGDVTTAQRM